MVRTWTRANQRAPASATTNGQDPDPDPDQAAVPVPVAVAVQVRVGANLNSSRVESADAVAAETICGLAPLDNLLGSAASRLSSLTRSFAFVCFSLALIMMMMMIVQLPPHTPYLPPSLLCCSLSF